MATIRTCQKLTAVSKLQLILCRSFMARHVRTTFRSIKDRKKLDMHEYDVRRSSFNDWNYSAELYAFSARLGENVQEELLRRVFTDKSYVTKEHLDSQLLPVSDVSNAKLLDNEQLLLEGDLLATSYIKGWLRAAMPCVPEEGIEAISAHLTTSKKLSELAVGLGMKDLLMCQEYPPSEHTYAGCLLAFIGAISSSSVDNAECFVRDFILAPVSTMDLHTAWPLDNAETVLMDSALRCNYPLPEPRLLSTTAPHSLLASYCVGFYSNKQLLGSAPGSSIEDARHLAARVALNSLMQLDHVSFNVACPLVPITSPATRLANWMPF